MRQEGSIMDKYISYVEKHRQLIMDTLDYCEKYGLKYLIRDFSVNEADMDIVRNALRRYANHPAFAGVKIQDEPGTVSFDIFSETHEIFKTLCPDKYYYINLLVQCINTSSQAAIWVLALWP